MEGTATNSLRSAMRQIRRAALDNEPIGGITHCFYRYPARFAPSFARSCIETLSEPGQIVLDPYMGGGTTAVEAMAMGRHFIGCDINSLSVFVSRAKITVLSNLEMDAVEAWANHSVPLLRCKDSLASHDAELHYRPRNTSLPQARWLRKILAVALASAKRELKSLDAIRFGRCALLNAGQWALNGRRRIPNADGLRKRITEVTNEMLVSIRQLSNLRRNSHSRIVLCEQDAESIDANEEVTQSGPADLVVTSPPYPGIHILYHRWQVDGRKESDTPYWLADCSDGDGAAYYNFADRRQTAETRYFEKALRSFSAVRRVMRKGAMLVQLLAFSRPRSQLRRYCRMMEKAGFREVREKGERRTWRPVPGRRWYANLKGGLPSSREVVMVHQAV